MTQIKTGVAVLAAIAVLTSCSNDDPAATPQAESDEPTTLRSTPSATYEIVPGESGAIGAGSWAIRAEESAEVPLAVIDVPSAGFTGGERWIWTNEAVLGYWTVSAVHMDPCTRPRPAASVGDTVEDLAAALDAQRLTTATDPVTVAVDGHGGLYLELSTPADLDYATCQKDGLVAWDDAPAWTEPAVTRLWILEVGGQRVVLTLNGEPTKATERVFTAMIGSAEFVEG